MSTSSWRSIYVGTGPPGRLCTHQASSRFIGHLNQSRAANLRNWMQVPVHARSRDYDLAGLAAEPERLSAVVAFDQPCLGDLTGSTSCTCSAISAPTRSRSPGSAARHRRRLLTRRARRRPRSATRRGRRRPLVESEL